MLRDDPDNPECRVALGNLIERVLVHPTGFNQPYDVSLFGRHAAYVGDLPLFLEYQAKNPTQNQAGVWPVSLTFKNFWLSFCKNLRTELC